MTNFEQAFIDELIKLAVFDSPLLVARRTGPKGQRSK